MVQDTLEKKIIKKVILEEKLSTEGLENLRMAKLKMRKAFRFPNIKYLPIIQVAEELRAPHLNAHIERLYCKRGGGLD